VSFGPNTAIRGLEFRHRAGQLILGEIKDMIEGPSQ